MRWPTVQLGEIAEMRYGKLPPKETAASNLDGFPIFTGYRVAGYCYEYLYDEPEVVVVARGVGGTGDVKMSPAKSWITNLSIVLLSDPACINKQFLLYRLRQEPLKERLNTGAAQAQITIESLKSYPITIPDIASQDHIADILSAYDDLIENNQRRIALLEEAARLLYREWFVHFRFPGHEHAKFIDGVPEGWQRLPASQAFDVNPKTPRRDEPTIRYVPMAALSETYMLIDCSAIEVRESASGARFQNGDTLLARITPCLENGKTGFVQMLAEAEVACGSTEFIVLRGALVSNYFVYLVSRQEDFRENAIHSMIGSSGRQRVQASCFDRYMVAVPPEKLAALFDESVQPMFEQIGNLDQQNQKLAQARDLLLPRLMSGELAV